MGYVIGRPTNGDRHNGSCNQRARTGERLSMERSRQPCLQYRSSSCRKSHCINCTRCSIEADAGGTCPCSLRSARSRACGRGLGIGRLGQTAALSLVSSSRGYTISAPRSPYESRIRDVPLFVYLSFVVTYNLLSNTCMFTRYVLYIVFLHTLYLFHRWNP